jgi:maltose-binding protein MalE
MLTKMTKTWIAIVGIILAIGLLMPSIPPLANTTVQPTTVTLTGTIRKLAVEGTCYQFTANDGKNYELLGKFPKRNGVKVQVRGEIATDVATICQVGQPFKVKSVRVVK